MATTAKGIVPDPKATGQKARKPMSKQHKAKLVAALANWRASLTDEDRAEQAERSRQRHKARWDGMTKKQRDAALAGVRAWQVEQRAAKAAKAKPPAMARAKAAPAKASRATEVSESAARARTRKAVAK